MLRWQCNGLHTRACTEDVRATDLRPRALRESAADTPRVSRRGSGGHCCAGSATGCIPERARKMSVPPPSQSPPRAQSTVRQFGCLAGLSNQAPAISCCCRDRRVLAPMELIDARSAAQTQIVESAEQGVVDDRWKAEGTSTTSQIACSTSAGSHQNRSISTARSSTVLS